MMTDMKSDTKAEFTAALAKFCALSADAAPAFAQAYYSLQDTRLHGLRPGAAGYDEALAGFTADAPSSDGEQHISGLDVFFLRDAVDIYERRHDEGQGQAALLFEPECQHIRSIRWVIGLLQGAFPEASPEYRAAEEVAQALDAVQASAYLPANTQPDGAQLSLIGYGDRGGMPHVPPLGKGIVCKTYGDQGAVLEMGSEALMPHLMEPNALFHLAVEPVDMAIIKRNGSVVRFNYSRLGAMQLSHLLMRPLAARDPSLSGFFSGPTENDCTDEEVRDFCEQLQDTGAKIDVALDDTQLNFVEWRILPYLAAKRPVALHVLSNWQEAI